ncbi:MAG: DUF2147 domain-containing protein [Rhodoblastus sp.]
MKKAILICAGVLAFAAPAAAADIVGTWMRSNGESRIRMAPCGGAVCGSISWLKTPGKGDAKVGQQVFFDMKPDGSGGWAGSAFNPEDGKTYAGKATVSGSNMTTKGCVLGGMICKSVSWTRVN